MNKRLTKKKIVGLLFVFLMCFGVASVSGATGAGDAITGLDTTANSATLMPSAENSNISTVIGKIVGAGLAFIGVVFMILIIYGGILWMTARGNEQQVEKAKELIYAAVIGLVIVLSAYAITYYVGGVLGQTSPGLPATTE